MFAGAKEKVLGTARRLVSQNKVRLKEDGFDLDLIYLTEQIICMGLPAQGSEALYRNPIDSVVRFLEKNHGGRYKVFNLCNERTYDISKFGDACASFPFDDHGAPPLALVVAFCQSAKSWLLAGIDNMVVVHCKAGKGRTGLMACCLLMHLGYHRTAAEAIAFYNGRRTKDGRGLTVPSQRRYVYYYERVLRGISFEGAQRTLRAVRLSGLPAKKVAKLSLGNSSALGEAKFTRLVVTIRKNGAAIPEAGVVIEIDPRLPLGAPHTARCNLLVSADLCVSLADEAGHELCKLWMHPNLEPEEACFVLANDKFRSEVDVSDKGALPDGFTLAFLFCDGAADETSGNTSGNTSGRDSSFELGVSANTSMNCMSDAMTSSSSSSSSRREEACEEARSCEEASSSRREERREESSAPATANASISTMPPQPLPPPPPPPPQGYVGAHVGANEAPSIPSGGEVLEQPPPPPRAAYADNDAGDSPGAAQDTPGHSARDES